MDAVVVDGLDVTRGGRPVLEDLSLTVPPGKVTGLLGPSGCGKSTLMRAIVGVQQVQGGDVTVLGIPAGAPELRRQGRLRDPGAVRLRRPDRRREPARTSRASSARRRTTPRA